MATFISVDDVTVGEKDGIARFTVSLDAPSASTVTVQYFTAAGTAAGNVDYTHLGVQTLTFTPGQISKTIDVAITNDLLLEPTENFFLGLQNPTNALISRAVGTATIIDNDAPSGTPVVSINDFVVDEQDKTATFVITLDRPSTSAVTMNYATVNGTALAGADYTATSGALTFAAGETAKTVKVSLLNDAAAESSEAFNLVLSSLVGATTLDPIGTAVIYENDAAPIALPSIAVEDVTVGESQAYADFLVRLNAPSTSAVSVQYFTASGTAAGNVDYQHIGVSTLNFAPGEMVKTVRVAITNDATAEIGEGFFLGLQNPTNAVIGRAVGTGTIIDNDAPSGTPVVSINDFVVDEQDKTATFVITLDRPSTSVVSMNFATVDAGALAGSDYIATSGTLNFAPGETAKTVKVTLLNDTVAESTEAFNLALSGLSGATTLDPTGTALIHENDATPVALPSITVEDVTVGESQPFVDFLVRLNAPSTSPVSVQYFTASGTAAGNVDYQHIGVSVLNFAPGEMVKTVRVTMTNDAAVETTENFFLGLQNATNAVISRSIGTATIIDNDAPSGTPVVSINDFVVDEQDKTATFVITLDRPSTGVVSMNYATVNGAALAGTDFIATSGSLNFGPGETAKTVKVTLLNDSLTEPSEAFNLTLSSIVGATTLDPNGTAIVYENDATPLATPSITVEDVTVGENQPYADFLVRLDAPSNAPVSVQYFTASGTAAGNVDYQHIGVSVLNFAPGEMVKTVRVTIDNDTGVEGAENFFLGLQNSTNAVIARSVGTGTIIDNDTPSGTPIASINDFVIDEADKTATFVVTLDRPSTSVVSMNYATANGSALSGNDYVAVSGSLNFAPGETAKTVKVTLLNDTVSESSEAFNLVLSNLTGASTLDANGTAIIYENDATPVATPYIAVEDVTVGEGQPFADFLVRLSGPSSGPVSVQYFTAAGSAAGNVDYTHIGVSVLNFAPGETVKSVRVTINNDTAVEGIENFFVGLQNATNAVISRSVATATIIDNDAPSGTPVVSISDAVVDEQDGLVRVTVSLDKPKAGTVTIKLATQGITALDGSDFRSFSNLTVAFLPGETAKEVVVGVLKDTTLESTEIADVAITSATGATIGDGRGHVFIAGNDMTAAASPIISVGGTAASEADGTVEVRFMLSAPSTGNVTVQYFTAAGTAAGNVDYGHIGVSTIIFAPGEIEKSIRINLINDVIAEPLENFTVNLQNAVGGTIGNVSSTITIVDDDSAAPASVPIAGTAQADILRGTKFADAMTGGNGNDVLDGAAGNDNMNGGAGDDIYIVEQTGDAVVEGAAGGNDKVIAYVTHTLAANVEELILGGTAAINGTGNTGNNILTGNSAANTLNGGTGNDAMAGAAGNDIYVVDSAGDVVTELASGGTDTVQSSISYVLGAQLENLTLTGAAALNGTGNTLANVIQGNSGNNVLDGGTGTDTASYANATAGVTVSLAIAGAQNTVGAGTDTLIGFENLTGSGLADTLTGNASANVISGGVSNDRLVGGAGNDRLTGGTGLDKFVFDAPLSAATNVDSVTDFTAGLDTIVIDKTIFTAVSVVNLPLDPTQFFAAAGATAGADASDRIVYNSTTGDLYYDVDGAGGSAATLFAKLTTHPAITATSVFVEA